MGINKQELIGKIHGIEGLSNEEKSALIELLKTHKKYGLVWEDKPEDVEERLRDDLPVLTEVKERAIISEDPDAPNHILIEGDNLEALTALSYTHAGKIDVIYIDPPYNTGNKDFVYNDAFVDKEDSFRHSKWLSFVSKRLAIAKRLLSPSGVIFISIDDNEQAQLKLLCDEIFGDSNFVGEIVWFKKRKGSFLSNKLVSLTEYILPYVNNPSVQLFGGLPDNSESQPIIKRTNGKKTLCFKANVVSTKLKDGVYPAGLYGVGSSASELLDDVTVEDGKIINDFRIQAPFTWGQEFLDSEIANGTEVLINTLNFQVRVIRRNNESIKALPSFLDGREFNATNEDAYEMLKVMFNDDRPFQYSKPVNLIKKLILANSYKNKDAIVLDFFAGSGTTLHATILLNQEDGGHRRCIIVTNNEIGICENVTFERCKKAILGYSSNDPATQVGIINNSLRYYKTDFVGRERSSQNMRQLVYAATDLLCIKEDLYNEVKQFGSLKLKSSVARYFEGKDKRMLAIYNELAVPAIAEEIAKMDFSGKVKIYVFAPGNYAYDDEFYEVQNKVELCALPAAIYNAYQKVLPKRKTKLLDGVQEESEQEENNGELNLYFGEE